MKNGRFLLVLLFFVIVLNGCNTAGTHKDVDETLTTQFVKADEKTISVEDINIGIKAVFNNVLYYNPNGRFNQFLGETIEYDLFFMQSTDAVLLPRVYIIITNMEHPLSNEQSPKLYKFGISITKHGLQSDFYEQSFAHAQGDWKSNVPEGASYLGHYAMCISEVTPPTYEVMTDQWKQRAAAAIRLYMDKNDFYSEKDKNLEAGKYEIYIQGFSESDVHSTIVFEHENGQIYLGQYYFVHSISNEIPADLNHVELVENADADFMEYLSRLKLNAAMCMEYSTD